MYEILKDLIQKEAKDAADDIAQRYSLTNEQMVSEGRLDLVSA